MADEHRFSADVDAAGGLVERKSGWKSCLTGCLIVCVILAVIAILIGVWIGRNVRNFAAFGIDEVFRQGMVTSQLPAQEQQEIMVQVERVSTAFRDGKMSYEQLGMMIQRITESPLIPLIEATSIKQNYIDKSEQSEEENAEDVATLRRFIRGALDGKINRTGFEVAISHIASQNPDKTWVLRRTLNDEQLRSFLAEAKKQADEAGIPEQPAAIDPSEEVKRIVDEALNVPAPPESEPVAAPASE